MNGQWVAIAMGLLVLSPSIAVAQETVERACEIHVWPSAGLDSVYHGWFHGGIVNGAVTGRDGYPDVPPDPINTLIQADLLTEANPAALLQRADHRLVVHPEALPSRIIRATPGRIEASAPPCYAELIVDDLILQQDFVNGSFLRALFRYREFGDGPAPTRSFGSWVKTPLKMFPPKRPEDGQAAADELRAAFKQTVSLFAEALLKPPKPDRKRKKDSAVRLVENDGDAPQVIGSR